MKFVHMACRHAQGVNFGALQLNPFAKGHKSND